MMILIDRALSKVLGTELNNVTFQTVYVVCTLLLLFIFLQKHCLIIIYFRLFNNPVDTPQPVTVYNYAIHKTQILTTNRTDSLQTQSISAQRGLELGTSRSLCQMLSNAPRPPPIHVIALDITKAFDTIRHAYLAEQLAELPILDCVYNWVVTFRCDRNHVTKYNGSVIAMTCINASIVQDSGLG